MATFVRVRDKRTGHTYSIAETAVDDNHEVLKDAEAVDPNGRPLEAEYAEPKSSSSTKKGS